MRRVTGGWLRLLAVGLLLLLVGLPSPAGAFLSDLAGHWSAAMVAALEARGVVAGIAPDQFAPDSPLTRAQMAKLFVVGLGYEGSALEVGQQPSRFADVPRGYWGSGYIEVMAELGLTAGTAPGSFEPEGPVTRAQLALFTVRGAGLTAAAEAHRSDATPYTDDAAIPDWARGAVVTALQEGLMQGLPEGEFEPQRPVTRAEGAAVLYRLLNRRGSLFHLAGTLVAFDPDARKATVRDALGQERTVRMDRRATYLRQGSPAGAPDIRPLDQVWIALSPDGDGLFLEAWYQDRLADRVMVQGASVTLFLPGARQEVRRVQPGALIYVNGREAPALALNGLSPVYVALDSATGEIRAMAALRATRTGVLVDPWADDNLATVRFADEVQELTWAEEPVILIDGARAEINELQAGDPLLLAFDEAGRIAYVEVTR